MGTYTKQKLKPIKCKVCGKKFTPHRKDKMTCSTECQRIWKREQDKGRDRAVYHGVHKQTKVDTNRRCTRLLNGKPCGRRVPKGHRFLCNHCFHAVAGVENIY